MLKDMTVCLEDIGYVNPFNKVYNLTKDLDYLPLVSALLDFEHFDLINIWLAHLLAYQEEQGNNDWWTSLHCWFDHYIQAVSSQQFQEVFAVSVPLCEERLPKPDLDPANSEVYSTRMLHGPHFLGRGDKIWQVKQRGSESEHWHIYLRLL